MKVSDATKDLIMMDEKRAALLDNCTRALCGDNTVNAALLDEATGGRYSASLDEGGSDDAIKTLLLALRWLALPPAKKTRKRRTTKKSASKDNGKPKVAKKRTQKKPPETTTAPPADPAADPPSA